MKLGRDHEVKFKKSFYLYCKILLKVLTKVGLNFFHFEWMKVKLETLTLDVAVSMARMCGTMQQKQPNLKLKTRAKQCLGSLLQISYCLTLLLKLNASLPNNSFKYLQTLQEALEFNPCHFLRCMPRFPFCSKNTPTHQAIPSVYEQLLLAELDGCQFNSDWIKHASTASP